MKIIFGFSKPKSERILSTLIRRIEKRPFSHSYVRLIDPMGLDIIFQASGLAVNLSSLDNFLEHGVIVEEYELSVDDSKQKDVWKYIIDQLGVSYSVFQLFWILLKKIVGLEIAHNDKSAVICSEQSARLCLFLGLMVDGDLDYKTPSDFQKFCVQNMKKIV